MNAMVRGKEEEHFRAMLRNADFRVSDVRLRAR